MLFLGARREGAEPFDRERGEQAVLKSGSTPSIPSQKTRGDGFMLTSSEVARRHLARWMFGNHRMLYSHHIRRLVSPRWSASLE